MIDHIIVATDLSENAGAAARWAQTLASSTDASVIAAHVIEISLSSWLHARYEVAVDEEKRAQAKANVADWYTQYAGVPPADVDLRVNSCFNALTEASAEHHADLLVMSPTGKSALAQLVVGSRLQEIASRPPCALAVAVGGPIKRMAIAIDFSEASKQALDWAFGLASALGAELRVLTVAELPDLPAFDEDLFGESFNAFYKEAEAQLKTLVAERQTDGANVKSVVITGNPEDALETYVRDNAIDALVLGQTGHDSVIGDILGSVPRGLINRRPCTIIVVPARAT